MEEGRRPGQSATEARFCLACRAGRRARREYVWKPEYDPYLKAHYYGDLHRRFQVPNRMVREPAAALVAINGMATKTP